MKAENVNTDLLAMGKADLGLRRLEPVKSELETLFIELTGKEA